jgi:hypothetical protein
MPPRSSSQLDQREEYRANAHFRETWQYGKLAPGAVIV